LRRVVAVLRTVCRDERESPAKFPSEPAVVTLLDVSANRRHTYMKLLVELGADPSLGNVDNCTPLMVACGIGVGSDQATEVAGEEPEVLEAAHIPGPRRGCERVDATEKPPCTPRP